MKLEEPFILPLDSIQRLLASLAFISEVTEGEKGLKQSRDIGPNIHHWDENKLFQSIEKCQFYRKLTFDNNDNNNIGNNKLSLYKKSDNLLNKFSEYGDNIFLCSKDIQVSRTSLTEISTSWLNLIDLFISYSSAASMPLYLLFEHNNEYSVIHIPPLISGMIDNQPLSLFQINKDVHLYCKTLNDLKFLLNQWIQPFRTIIESNNYNDDILEYSVVILVQSNWCHIDDKGNTVSINDRLESLQRILETQRQSEKEENIKSMKKHVEKLQTMLDAEDNQTNTSNSEIKYFSESRDSKFFRDSREDSRDRSTNTLSQLVSSFHNQSDNNQSQSQSQSQSQLQSQFQLPLPPSRLSSSKSESIRYSDEYRSLPPFTNEITMSQSISNLEPNIPSVIISPSMYEEEENIQFTKKKTTREITRFSVNNNLSESVVEDLMRSQEGEDLNSYGLRAYEMIKNKVFGKLNLQINNSIEQFNNTTDVYTSNSNQLNNSVTHSISDIKEMKETMGKFSPLSASANRDVDEILRKWNKDKLRSQDSYDNIVTANDEMDEQVKNSIYEYEISEQLQDDITVDTAPGFYSFMREDLSPERRSPQKKSLMGVTKELHPIIEQDPLRTSSNPWSPSNSPRSLKSSLKTSPVNTLMPPTPENMSMMTRLLPPNLDAASNSPNNKITSPQRLSFTLSPKAHLKQGQSESPVKSSSNITQPSREAIEYTNYHLQRSVQEVRDQSPRTSLEAFSSPKNDTSSTNITKKHQIMMSQHSPTLKRKPDSSIGTSPYFDSKQSNRTNEASPVHKSFYDFVPQTSSPPKSPMRFPQSQSLFGDSVSPQRTSQSIVSPISPQTTTTSAQVIQKSPLMKSQNFSGNDSTNNNNLNLVEDVVEDVVEDDDITILEEDAEEVEDDCDTTVSGGERDSEEDEVKKEISIILDNIQKEEGVPMIRSSLSNLIMNEMARNRTAIEGKRSQTIKEIAWKRKEQGLNILTLVLNGKEDGADHPIKNKNVYHPQKSKGVSIPTSQIQIKTATKRANTTTTTTTTETKAGIIENDSGMEMALKREKGKAWDININIEPKRPQQRAASAGPLQKRNHAYSNTDYLGDGSSVGAGTPRSKDRIQSAGKSRRGDVEQRVSNQQQIKNALTAVCLASSHFDNQRQEAISKLDQYYASRENGGPPYGPINQFIILLFNAKSLSFRGIYAVSPINGEIFKIFGKGPKIILSNYVQDYLKYETASRTFKILPTKNLSATVDAIAVDPAKLKKIVNNLVT